MTLLGFVMNFSIRDVRLLKNLFLVLIFVYKNSKVACHLCISVKTCYDSLKLTLLKLLQHNVC